MAAAAVVMVASRFADDDWEPRPMTLVLLFVTADRSSDCMRSARGRIYFHSISYYFLYGL